MKNSSFAFVFTAVAALCLSCTEPPPIPDLLGHPITKAERIILDDSIDARDIRQIFDAINEEGQLNTLAPWIHDASDAELGALGNLITRHIYQTAQDSNGLVAVLNSRIQKRAFSAALASSREFTRHADAKKLSGLVTAVLKSERFVEIVERDVGFLSPLLDESLDDLHAELRKAFAASDPPATDAVPVTPAQTVDDIRRFLSTPGLKKRFVRLSDSLADSSPLVGLLQSVRHVNRNYGGHAFESMGEGLARMIREPNADGTTSFDSLMGLVKALEGPSDGLFTSIQDKLTKDSDLVKELGSILQPNVPLRLTPYVPFLPNTVTASLIPLLEAEGSAAQDRAAWLALARETPAAAATQTAFFEFFKAARTAHENLVGSPREPDAADYLVFNLPLYLNAYALSHWFAEALQQNAVALATLAEAKFSQRWLDTKIDVKPFEFSLATADATGFDPDKLKELKAFGLEEFADMLAANKPAGLGSFAYSVPEMNGVTIRQALRMAMESVDEARGYADGSAVVRSVVATLTRRNGTPKSLLEGMETDDMLLASHRQLASIPVDTWNQVSTVLFDGMEVGEWSGEMKQTLVGVFEQRPKLAQRVSKVLDSLGVIQELNGAGGGKLSAFGAYLEIIRESGPREWRALSDGWLFLADSKLFSLQSGPDGKHVPRFPTAHAFLSTGNASGILRLISEVQPSRHRPFAELVHQMIRLRNGVKGSELHWDFLQELIESSPEGATAFVEGLQAGSLSNAREHLTLEERDWIERFVRDGSFRKLWEIVSPHFKQGSPAEWVRELKRFNDDGTLASTFRLMAQVKNDRIKALAKCLQDFERSGELTAFLDTLEKFLGRTTATPAG